MNLLNGYILKKFIRPFLTAFVGLCIMVMFAQVVDRLDRFMADGVNFGHVVGYLITSLPFQAMNILPVACLLGTLFVVGNLVRTREYIAGLAGGVPPEKFLGGIIMAGFIISLLALAANETVIPPATSYSKATYRQKIRQLGAWRQREYRNLNVLGADGRVWNTLWFSEDEAKMKRVVVDVNRVGQMEYQIDAKEAVWSPKGWTFQDGVIRHFESNGIVIKSVENFDEKLFPFEEKPSDMVIQEPQAEEMNYHTLSKHINRLKTLGVPNRKLRVELAMKLAFPFACFIVTLLGIPLALKSRGNRAIGIASGAMLTMAYMGFVEFGQALAQRLIPVWLGAWLGNIVFLGIAAYLWYRLRETG
jgi:lipopolysaccharide export system permease protein